MRSTFLPASALKTAYLSVVYGCLNGRYAYFDYKPEAAWVMAKERIVNRIR